MRNMGKKEVILIMDYRYDEGIRPRKELICPSITTKVDMGNCIPARGAMILERWSESNKQQNKDL